MNPRPSSLRFAAAALALLAASAPGVLRADTRPLFLGLEARPAAELPPALVSGEASTLRFLAPPATTTDALRPRLFQVAGGVARPVEADLSLAADPADSRLLVVRLTPPAVTRVSQFILRLGELPAQPLLVYPAPERREDLPPLADALRRGGLRLQVAGKSDTLRAWLRAQSLDFDDLGADAPARLDRDALLLATLSLDEWDRLVGSELPRGARLLAFVPDTAVLPGVYHSAALPSGAPATLSKITLPLAELLSADPRAKETLHHLVLASLQPAQP